MEVHTMEYMEYELNKMAALLAVAAKKQLLEEEMLAIIRVVFDLTMRLKSHTKSCKRR